MECDAKPIELASSYPIIRKQNGDITVRVVTNKAYTVDLPTCMAPTNQVK